MPAMTTDQHPPTHVSSPKRLAAMLASIAYAPIPPPGYSYVYRTDAPSTSTRAVARSPFSEHLSHHYDAATRTLYVSPTSTPPYNPATLPGTYRPGPPPPQVPLPSPPDRPPSVSEILETDTSGEWFIFPASSTSNASYYRRRFPEHTFCSRRGTLYARLTAPPPTPERHRSPVLTYEAPPSPTAAGHHDLIRDPSTAHVYVFRYMPVRHALPGYPLLQDSAHSKHFRYQPVPLSDLPAHHAFLAQYASQILIHPDAPIPLPPLPDRYLPLHYTRG